MKNIILALMLSLTGFVQAPGFANVQQVIVKEVKDIDTIWNLYHTSKDKAYIQQILEVINQDDEMMFLAYEYMNRHFIAEFLSELQKKRVEPEVDDIRKIVAKMEKKEPGFSNKYNLVGIAMSSMRANLKTEQDQANYKSLIQEHPELDYSAKINKILGK